MTHESFLPPAKPGALVSQSTITLQTLHAQRLTTARSTKTLTLWGYGRRIRQISSEAQFDDPYADWWLLKVEDAVAAARAELKAETAKINGLLQAMAVEEGLNVQAMTSNQPLEVPFAFASPHGNLGTLLVAGYDKLALALLTAQRHNLIDREPMQQRLRAALLRVTEAFNSVNGWHATQVTRRDLRDNTPLAEQARALMGECPADVASGSRRSKQAPSLRPRHVPPVAAWFDPKKATNPLAAMFGPAWEGYEPPADLEKLDPAVVLADPTGIHTAIREANRNAPPPHPFGPGWEGYEPPKKKKKKHKPKKSVEPTADGPLGAAT